MQDFGLSHRIVFTHRQQLRCPSLTSPWAGTARRQGCSGGTPHAFKHAQTAAFAILQTFWQVKRMMAQLGRLRDIQRVNAQAKTCCGVDWRSVLLSLSLSLALSLSLSLSASCPFSPNLTYALCQCTQAYVYLERERFWIDTPTTRAPSHAV